MPSAFTARDILRAGLEKVKVLVVGDLILDRTYRGPVERISPEAPIPVVHVTSSSNGLGGAGNVAHNLSRLGCKAVLAGTVGRDPEGFMLKEMLEEKGINTPCLLETAKVTTTKTRVVSARQQMLRLDFEQTEAIGATEEKRLLAKVKEEIEKGVGSVILSDYGKGVCTPGVCRQVIDLCHGARIPVIVDPKGIDWEKYRRAWMVTPNLNELGRALGEDVPNEDGAVESAGLRLKQRWDLSNLLVTRSDRGMTLFSEEGVLHEPALAREVFDVSGAGDTVVAVTAAFVSAGAATPESIRAANTAAGFVVGKAGTYAIGAGELLGELDGDGGSSSKVKTLEEASWAVRRWKHEGRNVVFTNGCFDILHVGHVHCLEKAKSFGDRLVVGLNSDESVRRLKGKNRPLMNQNDRAAILSALECVDMVVIFDEDTPLRLIRALTPAVLVKGGDYRPEDVVGRDVVEESGGRVEIVPILVGKSTTDILRLLSDSGRLSPHRGSGDTVDRVEEKPGLYNPHEKG
jgi:D-beta-D-heptose 7-phosphate kinase/D-beta-D-heptose 1-phosphate adenosyltransferase